MYAETGAEMRQAFAALLRTHRIQQRLGTTPGERAEHGGQIRQYRQSVLTWCDQTLTSLSPLTFSNLPPTQPNPFRSVGTASHADTPVRELARSLHLATTSSTAPLAGLTQLTAPTGHPSVELWRIAARAAALAEHDTAPDIARTMTVPQALAIVADIATTTQALVVLDQRYRNTPGWESLARCERLGWAALATALDVHLGRPDYTADTLGWRVRNRPITGPAKPRILGVLQAEHNLLVRLSATPSATNLRYIIDSQRLLSRHLAPIAARTDPRHGERWTARADTYATLQRQLRSIASLTGRGGHAAAEGATTLTGARALPPDTIIEPRTLTACQMLFDRIDTRIADIIEDGIDHGTLVQRTRLPRLVETTNSRIATVRERHIPLDHTTHHDLTDTLRRHLRPTHHPEFAVPGPSRADLHAALIHRTLSRGDTPVGPGL